MPKQHETVVKMQFGSHIYGTNLPSSDTDYKAIHIPHEEDIILQRCPETINHTTKTSGTKNCKDDVDTESFSLRQYLKLLLEGQTVALDMLFTPKQWIVEKGRKEHLFDDLRCGRSHLLHRGASAFVGYCRTQANKYGIKGSRVAASKLIADGFETLMAIHGEKCRIGQVWEDVKILASTENPHVSIVEDFSVRMLEVCNKKVQETSSLIEGYKLAKRIYDEYGHRAKLAEREEGIDWKAVMHALRVIGQAEELLTTGHITFPRPDAPFLIQVRTGRVSFKRVSELLDEGLKRVEACAQTSPLPALGASQRQWADKFVYDAYRDAVLNVPNHF